MEKKFNFGNKTVEVKLPSSQSEADTDVKFSHQGFCNCIRCEWVGGVESLNQAVKIQSVHLLCPDCGELIAEVSYHFSAPVNTASIGVRSRKFLS